MLSREVVPCEQLRPYVRLIWMLELDDPADFGPPERIFPDGLIEVVFHYRTPLACRYAGEGFARQPCSVAVSQSRRFLEIRPEGPSGLVSVRFHPWGAYHFFDVPVSEISDRQVPIEVLWGQAALDLEEQLGEAAGARDRVAVLERFLLAQLARHHKADVEPLVRAVWRCQGRINLSQFCRDLGIGERRLQRTFAGALGTTPKQFAGLSRFLYACSVLRSGPKATLTEVGLDCGYYDQSHFIADFKAFSGVTPRQFLKTPNLSFFELD